jgi:hypothetical protein
MKTAQKLHSLINKINFRNHKQTNSATVRYYIQITGRYGVKFFTRKRACEEGFIRQTAAHYLGFGPKALFTGKKKGYYYYVTEHAQLGNVNREQMARLRKQISSMGWSTFDLYSDNVGKVKSKPVLIDFDSCTLG